MESSVVLGHKLVETDSIQNLVLGVINVTWKTKISIFDPLTLDNLHLVELFWVSGPFCFVKLGIVTTQNCFIHKKMWKLYMLYHTMHSYQDHFMVLIFLLCLVQKCNNIPGSKCLKLTLNQLLKLSTEIWQYMSINHCLLFRKNHKYHNKSSVCQQQSKQL